MTRPSVSLIAVGIDDWPISCADLVRTVKQHEPRADLLIVDNCAPLDYPFDQGVRITRTDKRLSMAEAMNHGANRTVADWLVFMNNDLLCHGPFVEMIGALDPGTVWGVDMLNWWGRRWLDGWIMAVSRKVWHAVGPFDPAFLYAGFEDADYCFRAVEAGFKVEAAALPFTHVELHSRFSMPGYMTQRAANIAYLARKWNIPEARP